MGATSAVAGSALRTITKRQRPCLPACLPGLCRTLQMGSQAPSAPQKGQAQLGWWGEAFRLVSWPSQLSTGCQYLLSGSLKQRGRGTFGSKECLRLQAIDPEGWKRSHVPESERRIAGRQGQPAGLAEPSYRCHTHKGRGLWTGCSNEANGTGGGCPDLGGDCHGLGSSLREQCQGSMYPVAGSGHFVL